MTSKYQQGYRRMLVDMHIPDWDLAFLSKYEPGAMAALFQRADLTSVMLYCKSHVGSATGRPNTERCTKAFEAAR
jgi:hypothetical protein